MTNDLTYRRFPAEWEYCGAVLLSWPHAASDWSYMLDEVTQCYLHLCEALSQETTLVIVAPDIAIPKKALAHLDNRRILFCQISTNDTWARDFGPITVFDGDTPRLLDFMFNGWGLKFPAAYDNLITPKLHSAGLLRAPLENHRGFILEGGAIDSDGQGSLLTTSECLLSPNRNAQMSREDIEAHLCQTLGVNRVLWIDHGFLAGDDTDSHVDTLARFAPNDTILYVKSDDPADIHYDALKAMEHDIASMRTPDGSPYNLIGLPMPDAIYDEDGNRLPATYANFLVTPTAIFLPTYNQKLNDQMAEQILRIAFPDHRIYTVDCRALIKQHGSLHCVTMQLPPQILPI